MHLKTEFIMFFMMQRVKYEHVYLKYTMNITTIKLRKTTKDSLEKLRDSDESYDATVRRLIAQSLQEKISQELREGYQNKSSADEELIQVWEGTNATHD